ncbi:cytochrome C oxidase copper chaperone-domain-containing protein [Scenedesmus sp. NREL 46B-D3]|nr:cytochrome C oxidase copper chaperone-domain-containing protein [Scenedesmus sp. NREL 46B-D3]
MSWWKFGKAAEPAAAPEVEMPKKKICCACPDTKRLRDECVATHGEENAYCQALIEAHKACLRMEGFNV